MSEPIRDDGVLDAIRLTSDWLADVPNPYPDMDDPRRRKWELDRRKALIYTRQMVFVRVAELDCSGERLLRAVR